MNQEAKAPFNLTTEECPICGRNVEVECRPRLAAHDPFAGGVPSRCEGSLAVALSRPKGTPPPPSRNIGNHEHSTVFFADVESLQWGEHERDGGTHIEWHAPCGCAFHPKPFPHVHPCSDAHRRDQEERAIVAAAREWATVWGRVWSGDESATDKINDRSKSLHDAVLALEREIVLRRRRKIMPGYDEALKEWLS